MRAYDVEDANQDVYKNGVCCFRHDTPPLGIGAFAHIHSAIEIIYVTHGSLSVDIDDGEYNVFAVDVILFRSNAIHHILAGMSYSYFPRSFKAITGKSFKEYVNITRINRAERLLATTDKTVTEICSQCGYNNVAYFIKVFKKYKSMPPMAFKRKEEYYDNQKSDKFRYGRAQ